MYHTEQGITAQQVTNHLAGLNEKFRIKSGKKGLTISRKKLILGPYR